MKLYNADNTPVGIAGTEWNSYFDVPHREDCLEKLESLFAPDARPEAKGAILKVYLENFKFFNDTFGYQYSGRLLREIAGFLCTIPGADVYRFTGVEFVIVLEGASYAQMNDVSEAIMTRFEQFWRVNETDCMCAMNLGALMYPDFARSDFEALENLDHAITQSASLGQNQMVVFDSELQAMLTRRKNIARSITDSLSNSGIVIGYRPTFNVERQKYVRAECYLQLVSNEYGLVRETEFLPIAEQSGQICAINMMVIRKTCEFISGLLKKGVPFESVAVRISPVQLLQEFFPEAVQKILKEYDIPSGKLALEISESVLLTSFTGTNMALQELDELGVELILNEFGSGYSGITSILDLPIHTVKLERLFVWQMETNPRSRHLIQGLCSMAKGLGIKLIAEGVETENQVALLDEFGCIYRQGFYYSSVVDSDSIAAMLSE